MNSQSDASLPDRAQTMSSPNMASQISASASLQRRPVPYQQPEYTRDNPPMNAPSVGSYPNQRQSNNLVQPQPNPQRLPQPVDRRPYPQPQRIDSRQPPPQQFHRPAPQRDYPPSLADGYKPIPNRGYPAVANVDPYRTRSMASTNSQAAFNPLGNSYNQAPPSSFRQQPYQSMSSRTTAQGRVVPERHDERAMSMTSFSMDRDHNQTMSGRVIPNRRRESGADSTNGEVPVVSDDAPSKPLNSQILGSGAGTPQNGSMSRSMSMASTIVPPSERSDSLMHRPSVQGKTSNGSAVISAQSRAPLVYPALLSRVADVFQERITAGDRQKNNLAYKVAFTGGEAVDLIAYIIKTTDRNLALLLGRALDAQRFFHDVTYEHRLRDSTQEVYQFKESLMEESSSDVNGVFTLLTECYSPTCTRDRLCYSIACPRRLEQQARLNLKPQPGLRRQQSTGSLHGDENDEQKLWINTVSKEVADSVGDREKKRQEIISEIMYTERDFVKDLEYLRDFWMRPLRSTSRESPSPIPEVRREKFVRTVFSNCMDVHAVNSRLADALTRRQQENPVVRNVGDIFLTFVPRFDPFIKYGANQLYGKWEFERERAANPAFQRFIDETERLKESRKLELNGYLTKPTTRLARYPLLLEHVLKVTADDNPDKEDLPKAVDMIRKILGEVNKESGIAENRFNLRQLQMQLEWPPGEKGDLKLLEENRELVFKGALKKAPTDSSEIVVYLFNHALLLTRQKVVNKREKLKVYKRPIPLELLVITQMDEIIPKLGISKRPSSSLIPGAKAAVNGPKAATNAKEGFPITFRHIGKGGYDQTLFALSQIQRRKWMEHIEGQQQKLRERGNFYTKTIVCDDFFTSMHKVNCLVPLGKIDVELYKYPLTPFSDGGRKLVYGTESGIYVSDRRPKAVVSKPKRVLDVGSVTQIDVLEEYQLLLAHNNKSLVSFPLDALESNDNLLKKPKKIQNHAIWFKAGICMGRHLVCSAKMSGMSPTIRVFEPMDTISRGNRRPGISRMFNSSGETLKPFKVSARNTCTSA